MSEADGNGWVECGCGHRHWGLHGAAGLAVVRRAPGGRAAGAAGPAGATGAAGGAGDDDREAPEATEVLLQLRSSWTHHGGTWGFPGGAKDSHESTAQAALREAHEEVGLDPAEVSVVAQQVTTDHGDWSYSVVVAASVGAVSARSANGETDAVAWFPVGEVAGAPLHPGLRATWDALAPVVAGALRRDR